MQISFLLTLNAEYIISILFFKSLIQIIKKLFITIEVYIHCTKNQNNKQIFSKNFIYILSQKIILDS